MSKIKLLINMSELGTGTQGSSKSFDALKIAEKKGDINLFKKYAACEIENNNDLLNSKDVNPFAKHVDGIVEVFKRVCDAISNTLVVDKLIPVVLAAGHSSAAGTVAGVRKAYPDKKIGIIWIDAHADLHTPYTSHSGNIHGMPVAAMLGIDNKEDQFRDIDEEAVQGWEAIKAVGGISPKIDFEDIVQYAVRDTEPEEDRLIDRKNIKAFTVAEIRKHGAVAVANKGLEYLKDHDLIYVSFDVDSLDASISRGTGTPVENGISTLEAEELIMTLLQDSRICCFEMVEINPLIDDKGNTMAETAYDILEMVVNKLDI